MFSRKILAGAALAVVLAAGAGVTPASAVVTYHFAETTGLGNATGGIFSGPGGVPINNPVTFDFTVATALAANTTYNFGVTHVENGDSGNVLDFRFSDGTAISTYSLADVPAVREIRGGPFSTDLSRIHVQTDANGAISLYDILIAGRSTFNHDELIGLQLQHSTPNAGVGIVMSGYDYGGAGGTYRFTSGSLQCVIYCGGSFTSAEGGIGGAGAGAGGATGSVPEPDSWALMGAGFVGVASVLRRRRAAAAIV